MEVVQRYVILLIPDSEEVGLVKAIQCCAPVVANVWYGTAIATGSVVHIVMLK